MYRIILPLPLRQGSLPHKLEQREGAGGWETLGKIPLPPPSAAPPPQGEAGPLREGAVAKGDWGSTSQVSLCSNLLRAILAPARLARQEPLGSLQNSHFAFAKPRFLRPLYNNPLTSSLSLPAPPAPAAPASGPPRRSGWRSRWPAHTGSLATTPPPPSRRPSGRPASGRWA